MKATVIILKILAALAAIAGAVYALATYGDKIVAWAKKLLGYEECDWDCCCQDDCDNCKCECDCDTECPCHCAQEAEEVEEAEEAAEEAPVAEDKDFE